MNLNWKKTAIILTDIALAAYLILAITAFNNPDETNNVCNEVNISIKDGVVKGFLNANEIKQQLQHAKLYPLGDLMSQVNTRKIEETLRQNSFVENAECYKTQSGHIHINLIQRQPIVRVKADNGDDYYVDEHGNIMPDTHYVTDLVVATGAIQRKYAQKQLMRIGNFLLQNPLWRSQIEQINVLPDGSVEMTPRVGDHLIYLGQPVNMKHKLERLEKFYKYGLSQAGWNKYSYISLEFDNQIICKKRKKIITPQSTISNL